MGTYMSSSAKKVQTRTLCLSLCLIGAFCSWPPKQRFEKHAARDTERDGAYALRHPHPHAPLRPPRRRHLHLVIHLSTSQTIAPLLSPSENHRRADRPIFLVITLTAAATATTYFIECRAAGQI